MAVLRDLSAQRASGWCATGRSSHHRTIRHHHSAAVRMECNDRPIRQSCAGARDLIMKLGPVTLEIMATKVAAVADEMGYTLQRTGRTLYVKETADFSTALATRNGKFFAYPGAIGVSGFVDLDCRPTIEVDEARHADGARI